jgi:hypothetical protein
LEFCGQDNPIWYQALFMDSHVMHEIIFLMVQIFLLLEALIIYIFPFVINETGPYIFWVGGCAFINCYYQYAHLPNALSVIMLCTIDQWNIRQQIV